MPGIRAEFFKDDELHSSVFVSKSSDFFKTTTDRLVDEVDGEIMMDLYHSRGLQMFGETGVEIFVAVFGLIPSTYDTPNIPNEVKIKIL